MLLTRRLHVKPLASGLVTTLLTLPLRDRSHGNLTLNAMSATPFVPMLTNGILV
jgi:hypothetical protein